MTDTCNLIEFTTDGITGDFRPLGQLSHAGVHVMRAQFAPNPGRLTGAARFLVGVHESGPMDFTWQLPRDGKRRQTRFDVGSVYINPAHRYFFQQWHARPQGLIIALDDTILDLVGDTFGGRRGSDLLTVVGARDPEIEKAARILSGEIAEPHGPGRLLAEGVSLTLAVHLFRTYSDRPPSRRMPKGALGAARLRRVIDFIETHIGDDISLLELADVAGLSVSHFGAAFKAAVGLSPYRYVIKRRVHRGEDLLRSSDRPITSIAYELGFPSHGHFSTQFQRHIGVSPSRYRNDGR
ncbi:helix-turn-helix domain-containing protein [Hephaestia sp. GCM10023244]|uniref:helix-turn-helix domain-containing protein n=1 Tax=unclassified Hephaestia TaxID=2631281 RepID=UPI0020770E3A|nr:AraC family transcriptional regulator [Hephaestia sp. MAHUQ-44]MCM8732401.1 AraC family transcriptional regulator [Hephaestia sp. MAHUQ-44]